MLSPAQWRGQSPAQVAGLLAERAPFWVSLLLVIAIGYYAARLFWLVIPTAPHLAWQPPPLAAADGQVVARTGDYRSIAAAHLFGRATADGAANPDAVANAPDTSLNLQLRGAIAAGDSRFSHAIIADGSGNEKVYFVSDSLPGGAKLQRVEADRVLIDRGGTVEVLRLPRLGAGSGGAPMAASPMASGGPDEAPAPVQTATQQNAATFLDVVRPQPFMPNGQLKGYRVYPGPQRQQFAALGLRPGDLVTEINGVALNNPSQGMEVFRSIGSQPQVTVTVERDGTPQVLTLSMNQVNTLSGATQ